MKSRTLCLWLFAILALADIVFTYLAVKKHGMLLELNWLAKATNSLIPVILFNIFVLWLIYKTLASKRPSIRFLMVSTVIWLSLLRILAIYNNWQWIKHIPKMPVEQMQEIAQTATQQQHYAWLIGLGLYSPILISMLIFAVFRLDFRFELKNE